MIPCSLGKVGLASNECLNLMCVCEAPVFYLLVPLYYDTEL